MWIIKDFKNTSTAGSVASMENSPHAENDAAVANQNVITPTNTSTTAKMEKKPRRRKQILANFLRDFNVFQLQSSVSSTDLKLKGAFKMGKFGDILSCESPNYIVKRFYLDAIDEKLLRREISIHCNLQHQHIVPCLGVLQRPDREVGLVLNRCRKDLFEYMHGNRLGTVEIVDILRQVTTALQYIASLHIAHRDIKPENILVVRRDESTVQLADFGWSIRMESKDAWCYTAMAGTAEYVPPECLKVSQPYQGQFVDRWALGLLAYELTQRESYFGGDDILKSIDAFKRLNADCFDECNEEKLIDFCRKLVRRKPNRRMTFEDALEHPFLSPAPPTLKRSGSCGMEAPVKRTRITTPLVVPLGETFL